MDTGTILTKIHNKEITTIDQLKAEIKDQLGAAVATAKNKKKLGNWSGYIKANNISDLSQALAVFDTMGSGSIEVPDDF